VERFSTVSYRLAHPVVVIG